MKNLFSDKTYFELFFFFKKKESFLKVFCSKQKHLEFFLIFVQKLFCLEECFQQKHFFRRPIHLEILLFQLLGERIYDVVSWLNVRHKQLNLGSSRGRQMKMEKSKISLNCLITRERECARFFLFFKLLN